MNKVLKNQIAGYYSSGKELNAELLELFNVISQTYEYYEDKLRQREVWEKGISDERVSSSPS